MMKRRQFFLVSALTAAGVIAGAPAIHANTKFSWKLVTSWPPNYPILQTSIEAMAKRIEQMSEGRLAIRVYAGGELVPALEVFDAVSAGTVEMGNGASYYWAGKVPEAQFFTSIPFGFNAQQMSAWLNFGGGLELWNKAYEPFNLIVMPALETGAQMSAWYKKEIKSLADLKGLKMRAPGLGAKAMAKAGVSIVLLPGGELYTALERGVIDAADWIAPYHDMALGLHRAASYYYHPGWREPCGVCELTVNRTAWDSLPKDLQAIVRAAAAENYVKTLAEFDVNNAQALRELRETYKVKVTRYPDDVLRAFKKYASETIQELAAVSQNARAIYDSYHAFAGKVGPWTEKSQRAYMAAKDVM
ncbi:MAG: TRAP transporter substrate-binding protein [Nitrospinae bacterium]|nr:TRAP transporter substrate-binding protein [Nitrospinota bacterium]